MVINFLIFMQMFALANDFERNFKDATATPTINDISLDCSGRKTEVSPNASLSEIAGLMIDTPPPMLRLSQGNDGSILNTGKHVVKRYTYNKGLNAWVGYEQDAGISVLREKDGVFYEQWNLNKRYYNRGNKPRSAFQNGFFVYSTSTCTKANDWDELLKKHNCTPEQIAEINRWTDFFTQLMRQSKTRSETSCADEFYKPMRDAWQKTLVCGHTGARTSVNPPQGAR